MGLSIFGNSDFDNPEWVSDKNTRGTWNLIQTCLITLGLCVYSAVHLNCFERGCSEWMKYLVRAKWLVVALLAPEFIVFNAWSQRRQAVRLAKMLRRRSGQQEPKTWLQKLWDLLRRKKSVGDEEDMTGRGEVEQLAGTPDSGTSTDEITQQQTTGLAKTTSEKPGRPKTKRKNTLVSVKSVSTIPSTPEEFGLIHGFTIVMGGLVIDMSRDPERVWPSSCNTLVITPACFEECFEKPGFRDIDLNFITRERIEARQKIDRLAKFLVIVQALWFCINFAVRLAQKLPVSLLELNTFAHALCALFIYVLWWEKPGDIEEPFVLRTEKSEALRDLCAAQWTSGASGKLYEGQVANGITPPSDEDEDWDPMFAHAGSEIVLKLARGRKGIVLSPGSGEDWYLFDYHDRWFFFPHLPSTARFHLRTLDPVEEPTLVKTGALVPGTPMKLAPHFPTIELDAITLRRWHRTFRREDLTRNYTVWLRDRQPNLAWPRGLDDSQDGPRIAEELLKAFFMLLVTSLCYGGLHMLAWDSGTVGSTNATQTLWKMSCLMLMGLGPFAYSVWLGLKMWRGADAHLRLNQSMSIVFGIVGVVALVAYIVSRVFLLVEICFVVPYVDRGVYIEPEFAAYWPHF